MRNDRAIDGIENDPFERQDTPCQTKLESGRHPLSSSLIVHRFKVQNSLLQLLICDVTCSKRMMLFGPSRLSRVLALSCMADSRQPYHPKGLSHKTIKAE
jgi:hypothetical protein